MRISKMLFGILATVGLFAAIAASASARQFTVTDGSAPAVTRGPGEGLQQLTLTPFTVRCQTATSTGKITASATPTLFDDVTYTKCTTYTLPVKFLTPVDYEYNAEGFASIVNPVALQLKVGGISCLIEIPNQRIPGEEEEGVRKSAIYSTEFLPTNQFRKFPTGFRERIVIRNRFSGIVYSLSGGLCEGLEEKEHEEGTGSGILRDEITTASLGWE
jgi:hypothetical protein